MTNHLNLRHTLLEFDLQGNLLIFSNGRSVSLQAKDVPQFILWLSTDQQSGAQSQQIGQYHFKRVGEQIRIDALTTIPAGEVQQISSWLRQWHQKNQARSRQADAFQ
jgi:hypothetical protein